MSAKHAREPSGGGRVLNRWHFLKVGGAGIAGMGVLGMEGCGGSGQGGSGTVTYADGPDETGTLQQLLDGFNEKYKASVSPDTASKASSSVGADSSLRLFASFAR